MESSFFSADDDSLFSITTSTSSSSIHTPPDDRLYLVHHRWWNEARESVCKEVHGELYGTSCSFADGFEPEIVLEMRRSEEEGVSGRMYALVSEWMFYRALKWHYDMKNVDDLAAIENSKADLFFLQVRLSISRTTNSLVVKINEKDNEVGAFNKSCQIFCVNSGLLKIWDFSGQITKFFLQGSMLPDGFELVNEEISLELQVYGLSYDTMLNENDMAVEDSETELKVNGESNKIKSYMRPGHLPFASSFHEPYNLGLTGLYNLGNTCFMNSAIQCLAHTPQLVDYFLGDFRKDLNFENPLGMNGKLALAFGDLLRQLWTPNTTSVAPQAFKSTLAGFAPQFGGYNQHDSQEFLAFLLDGLHEDLNRVKIKPYYEIKDVDGIPDKEVADEHWRNHLARNNSIIVDLCQGQYRSTLICPLCKKLSVTFDPFLYLSLPLPSTTMRAMTLTVLTTDGSTLPIPVTVSVPKSGKFKDLIQALSISCSLRDDETLLVAEIYNNCIIQFLDKPSDSLELVRDHDQLVAYRLPKDQESLPLVVFTHCHFEGQGGAPRRFGIPLVARIPECIDGFELRKIFLQLLDPLVMFDGFSSDSLDDDSVTIANQDTEMDIVAIDDVAISDEVKGKLIDDVAIRDEVKGKSIDYVAIGDEEVKGNSIDHVAIGDEVKGKSIDDVAVSDEVKGKSLDDVAINDEVKGKSIDDVAIDDEVKGKSVDDVAISDEVKGKSTVDESFHFSLEKEWFFPSRSKIVMDEPLLILGTRKISVLVSWTEEAVKQYDTCILSRLPETGVRSLLPNNLPESVSLSKCVEAFLKEEPLGPEDMWYCPKCKEHQQASKKLDLWRLPEILIIHLKRFSYNWYLKDKLETFVDFPIVDFDLSSYTVHKDAQSPSRYNLYAISNHYGGMGGGHYTAFAQCGEQWYEFNDSMVFPISEDQIKTSAAYVLFYKRS